MTTVQELPTGSTREPADPDTNIRRVAALLCAYSEMTHGELAERIGVNSGGPMSLRMSGKRPFRTVEVARMAEVFGLPVQIFFDGPDALFRNVPAQAGLGRGLNTPVSKALTSPERVTHLRVAA